MSDRKPLSTRIVSWHNRGATRPASPWALILAERPSPISREITGGTYRLFPDGNDVKNHRFL